MAYQYNWENLLTPGEEIKFEFSLGKRYIFLSSKFWVLLGIPFLFFYGIGIIFILTGLFWGWYLRRSNNFIFTNKRLVILRGWLSTRLNSIHYNRITDIKVRQPFFERMIFNTGTFKVSTAGTAVREVILLHIENPHQVKRKLLEIKHDILKKAN